MNVKGRGLLLAASVLGSILAASPVLAQSHGGGGGGGHAGGGGGHFGGGGHAAAPAGHFGGGGHFAAPGGGGRGYAGGGAGVHAAYAGGYHGGAYAGHAAYGNHYFAGRPGYGGYRYGYSTGAYWRGGYWGGGYWPRAWYGPGFSWFLPVLPLAYATYWWSGVPYYYANDVYYTYSPDYQGYVATDPPPVNDQGQQGQGDGAAQPQALQGDPNAGAPPSGSAPPPSGSGNLFMYPKNGQSAEQQAQDRSECQAWAGQQAGSVAQNGSDYQRAMVACVEGRGYSAR